MDGWMVWMGSVVLAKKESGNRRLNEDSCSKSFDERKKFQLERKDQNFRIK